jgi:DNA-directed RNA polymerase subunit K/omega
MLQIPYTDIVKKLSERGNVSDYINSPYSIVIAVSKRARDINNGAKILVDYDSSKNIKTVAIAIMELYSGKLKLKV